MCYTILVVEKYCKRKHIQAAKLCWRQCKSQAAISYNTKDWRQLCANRKRTDQEHETWYPFTPLAADPICDVCLCLESDPEAQELRTVLDPIDILIQDCRHALNEQNEMQNRIEEVLISDTSDTSDTEKNQLAQEYHVLSETQHFIQKTIDRKHEQVRWCQDRYDEIERRYESVYCDPILDRAIAMFKSRFLIYMGRPDHDELEDLDCPRHLLRCEPADCEITIC